MTPGLVRRAGPRGRGWQEGGGEKRATASADGETITVHIPLTLRKRVAMVKALARAFRWRTMLGTGVHATLKDLAKAKGVAPSYVSRMLG